VTVLITGAFGQIGKRCTEILLRRGRTVVAMDLRNDRSVALARTLAEAGPFGRLVTGYADLLDVDAVNKLVVEHQPCAVIHFAAVYSPPSYRNPTFARKVNVEGTRNLVEAAKTLAEPPLFLKAPSAAVYGSRNPYRYPERISPETPVDPIDQYGEDKVLAETVIRDSGLPYAVLRLGGVISPDAQANLNGDYLLLMRATPGDNRMHAVDSRDVWLAFANAVDRAEAIDGKVLVIAGDESFVHLYRNLEDDIMAALVSAGWDRRPACRAIRTTTAGGVSPAGSTPPNRRPCSISSSTAGRRPSRGSGAQDGAACCCARPGPSSARPCVSPSPQAGAARALRRSVDADRQEVRSRRARGTPTYGLVAKRNPSTGPPP
jgi:nucleoside-diphosphate-sugar epimerase